MVTTKKKHPTQIIQNDTEDTASLGNFCVNVLLFWVSRSIWGWRSNAKLFFVLPFYFHTWLPETYWAQCTRFLKACQCSGVFFPFREQECKLQNLCFKIHLRVCISENSLRRGGPGGERLWTQEELGCTVQDALHRWFPISTCALPNLSGLIWDIFWNVTWQAGSKAKLRIMVGKQRTSVFALFL